MDLHLRRLGRPASVLLPILFLSVPALADDDLVLASLTASDSSSNPAGQTRWGGWRAMDAGYTGRRRMPNPPDMSGIASRAAALAEAESPSKALWLYTDSAGLYQISVAELAERTPWSERRIRRILKRGKHLALTNEGNPVSWHYDEQRDAVVFVAKSYDSIHTDENAYQLLRDKDLARPMARSSGDGPAAGTPASSFRETLHSEEEPAMMYSPASVRDNTEADYWFGNYLFGGYQDSIDIQLRLPGALRSGQGELRVALRGMTDFSGGNRHRVRAELNGTPVGNSIEWEGFAPADLVVSFGQNLLNASGDNTLTLVTEYAPGETPGQWYNWTKIDYWRAPYADNGQLMLHDLEAGVHSVGSLSGGRVFLIENPHSTEPVWREDYTLAQASDGSWQLTFDAPEGGRLFGCGGVDPQGSAHQCRCGVRSQ